jgi:hypothetical protein
LEQFFETNIEAEYVGKRLDFLTKELVRLREEQRIAAMVKFAERTRRMREAEERGILKISNNIGQRESELQRREKEDQIFKQFIGVHQETVESYLEDIIISSTEETAEIQARQYVAEYADKLNTIVDDLTSKDESLVVADLVSSFLIPEVERETIREQSNLNPF